MRVFIIHPKEDNAKIRLSKFATRATMSLKRFEFDELKKDISNLSKAELIVTAGDWFSCDKCGRAIQISRLLNIPIIHESQFESYAETIRN